MSNEEAPPPPRGASVRTKRIAVAIGVIWLLVLYVLLTRPRSPEQARFTHCRNNLKQIGLGVVMYWVDHDDQMPPNLQTLVDDGYIMDVAILHCPSDPAPPVDAADVDASASYYYARVKDGLDVKSAERVPIAWEKKPWHGPERVNVLFADLHAESLKAADLEKRLQLYRELYDQPLSENATPHRVGNGAPGRTLHWAR